MIIWDVLEPEKLTVEARRAIGFTRLALQARDFQVWEITPEIAELSVNFGGEISKDPVDRIIAATSIVRNAPVVTADRNLRDANIIETIW